MKKLLGLVILAPALVLVWAPRVLAGDFVCTVDGIPGDGDVINENFIVPKGATCTPGDGVVFRQNVKVEQNGEFTAFAMTVLGDFQAEKGSEINIGGTEGARSVFVQNAQFAESASARLCNLHVEQDLQLDDVKSFRVGSTTAAAGSPLRCFSLDEAADGVTVGQNIDISDSTGILGNTTVEDDFKCDDKSEVKERGPVSVGGDDDCDTL